MYYNLRRMPDGYRMAKFDSLYNVEAVYNIEFYRGRFYCDCPASGRPDCKHRQMIPIFSAHKATDSGRFFCYDTGQWHPPIEGLSDIPQYFEPKKYKRKRKS